MRHYHGDLGGCHVALEPDMKQPCGCLGNRENGGDMVAWTVKPPEKKEMEDEMHTQKRLFFKDYKCIFDILLYSFIKIELSANTV